MSEYDDIIQRAFDIVTSSCEAVKHEGYSLRFECSVCGYSAIVHNCASRLDELPSYCPNCGRWVRS